MILGSKYSHKMYEVGFMVNFIMVFSIMKEWIIFRELGFQYKFFLLVIYGDKDNHNLFKNKLMVKFKLNLIIANIVPRVMEKLMT